MRKPLVIYHAQCRDGWAAAWAASKALPEAELLPAMYGQAPPPSEIVAARDVYVVDFCYQRAEMETLAALSQHLVVYDHHKTAQAALDGFDPRGEVVFDMERSGAGITWDELIGGGYCEPVDRVGNRPWLIAYVEDRDLWHWALPNSREVNAYLSVLPYGKPEHLAAWDEASLLPLTEAISAGKVALQAIQRYAENVADNAVMRTVARNMMSPSDGTWMSWDVPSVNAPQHDISEVLERLMDMYPDAPFVHGWWQRADGVFSNSLRSRGDFDVSAIAKTFVHNGKPGGGHKNSAGFQTSEMLP